MSTTRLIPMLLLLFFSGCGPWLTGPGSVRMWAVPDSTVLLPGSPPEPENEVFSNTTSTIRLEAAVNETVAFQLAFRGEFGQPSLSDVSVADFRQQDSSITAANHVRLYRQHRIAVEDYPTWFLRLTPHLREPRAFPDILVPLDAPVGSLPLPLAVGRCEALWIDVTVPPGTEPGIYRSTVTAAMLNGERLSLELMLTVHPFSLPLTQHLAVVAGIDSGKLLEQHLQVDGRPYAPRVLASDDPAYDRAVRVIDATIALLHDHRCSAMLTDVQPTQTLDEMGNLQLDWHDYDRLVASILDGSAFEDRLPALAWPMPIDERMPDPKLHGGWGSAAYGRMLTEYLRQCAAHFAENGWLDRHFVWIHPPDDLGGVSAYSRFAWLGSTVRRADPRLALVCDLPPQPMRPYGMIDDHHQDLTSWVQIWAPPASLADRDTLDSLEGMGRRIWLHPDRPPYCGSLEVIAPADHARSLAWQAYRFGSDAIFLPRVNDWSEQARPSNAASPHALLWPGGPYGLDKPVPSIRLKRLLRGVQDYEYLWLLEHNQRPAVADLIAADLFAFGGTGCYGEHYLDARPNGWVRRGSAWLLARSLMARELTAAVELAEQTPSTQPVKLSRETGSFLDFAHKLDWRRHVEGVRRVNTYVEGVRVRLDPAERERPLSIAATVVTFNATREPYSGTITMPEIPDDWQPGTPVAPIENLRPTRTTLREFDLLAPGLPTNIDGVMELTLRTQSQQGESADVPARLCSLTAMKLAQPVVMDGNLDEWPLATNNAAGDFVLVGALDVPKVDRHSPDRASQQTIVFAGHDGENLYIAFNCQDDRMNERLVSNSNRVSYDDLWPTGEDVIEIVLDPAGDAVVPQDLLHIAVKPNGAVITERGAPCLAGAGGHGDWAGFVTAAIDATSQPGRWMAEIRIPLSSLGKLAPVFGVNFARFNARLGEYSTWSGARRYLYSPASLGNMQLGR